MLSQAYIKSILDYDMNTGIFTWIDQKFPRWNGKVAGNYRNGYIQISIKGKKYSSHRLAYLYVHGFIPNCEIDHINGIRDDNRICNLRAATKSQNQGNQRKPRKDNTSGYLGVSENRLNGKFKAQIEVNKENKYLGQHETAEEAHQVYLEAKRKYHSHCTI